MILIKNVEVYSPQYKGKKDVFVSGGKISLIEDKINFDSEKIKTAQELIHNTTQGMIVVYGIGAALVTKGDILVYNNI